MSQYANQSDFISFKFETIIDHYTATTDTAEGYIAFISQAVFGQGEEFAYAYSKNEHPLQMLFMYGMVVPDQDNPHVQMGLQIKNVMDSYSARQKQFCELV
jgi:hypothetical protein